MKKRFMSILLVLCMALTMLPMTAHASHPNNPTPKNGWYYLRCMGNYLNLDANGNAELRDKTNTPEGNAKFFLYYLGNGGLGDAYSLETMDGRYLGVDGVSNGARVKALVRGSDSHLQSWRLCGENKPSKDICSLRPMANRDMILNASGQQKADGTAIILWSHIDKWVCPSHPVPDGPEHSEFRFIPTDAPAGATAPGTPKTPADGWYSLRFDVHEAYSIIDVIRADLVELNAWNCATPWTRAFYVENKGNNQITLRIADGRYLGVGTDAVSDYGWKVAAVKSPFLWNTYSESLGVANSHRKYSLRPASDTDLVVRAYTVGYNLGDPITVFRGKGAYGRSEVVFWELSGDEIPKTTDWAPAPSEQPTPAAHAGLTAAPSQTSFVMNGQPVSVTAAYSINNTNYLQLRAVAAILSGTAAQFDVGYDGQYAVIEPGKPYSGTVAQTKLQNTTNIRPSGTKFKMNGEVFTFADARLIDGDTNYLQLREFAQKLSGTASQFNVYYDNAAGQAVIQPGAAYTGTAS
ncbi:MAG: hypothetical protein KBA08_09585 [Firmicutes bacterium]|nr:hypothetical protein [Bacillota bacterium]